MCLKFFMLPKTTLESQGSKPSLSHFRDCDRNTFSGQLLTKSLILLFPFCLFHINQIILFLLFFCPAFIQITARNLPNVWEHKLLDIQRKVSSGIKSQKNLRKQKHSLNGKIKLSFHIMHFLYISYILNYSIQKFFLQTLAVSL